jgi:hypothetical protein
MKNNFQGYPAACGGERHFCFLGGAACAGIVALLGRNNLKLSPKTNLFKFSTLSILFVTVI